MQIIDVLKQFPNVILSDVNDKEIEEKDKVLPWEKKKEEIIPTDLPKYIDIVLYDRIYISKKNCIHSSKRS